MKPPMRYLLPLLALVGCYEPSPEALDATLYVDDAGWSTDVEAGVHSAGMSPRWVDRDSARFRIRIFAHANCPTNASGEPEPAYSCPGGPIHIWTQCGEPVASAVARHIALRAADHPLTPRVDSCSTNVQF
jgi:hypothetical protein